MANTMDIIDRSITPDPFNPQQGDVYGREVSAFKISQGGGNTNVFKLPEESAPIRIVIDEYKGDGDWWAIADGKQRIINTLPLFLASIDGMQPIGRVRTKAV